MSSFVLTHSPDVAPDLPSSLPLVLAGHIHCGQVVLPWIGPLIMRAPKDHWRQLYNPRYRCGIVRDGARTTIVTADAGSGTSPIRLGAMPDWWLDPRTLAYVSEHPLTGPVTAFALNRLLQRELEGQY